MLAFPDHDWQPWRFASLDPSWWSSIPNQRQFLDHFAPTQNLLQQLEHHFLYDLTWERIGAAGGNALKVLYEANLLTMAQAVYPDRQWQPWKFGSQLPSHWWLSESNRKQYFGWLASHLNLQTGDDWYRLDANMLRKNYGP